MAGFGPVRVVLGKTLDAEKKYRLDVRLEAYFRVLHFHSASRFSRYLRGARALEGDTQDEAPLRLKYRCTRIEYVLVLCYAMMLQLVLVNLK